MCKTTTAQRNPLWPASPFGPDPLCDLDSQTARCMQKHAGERTNGRTGLRRVGVPIGAKAAAEPARAMTMVERECIVGLMQTCNKLFRGWGRPELMTGGWSV